MTVPPVVLLVPTAAGLRVAVDGQDHFKPMTALQLLDLSRRLADAAAERLRAEETPDGS